MFGFQSPNTEQPDYQDFLLFDWKQADQDDAKEGFCLRRGNPGSWFRRGATGPLDCRPRPVITPETPAPQWEWNRI